MIDGQCSVCFMSVCLLIGIVSLAFITDLQQLTIMSTSSASYFGSEPPVSCESSITIMTTFSYSYSMTSFSQI